ncbi:hypothetical protein ACHAXR_012022 [Thalassiosira sp. AJA248-18]
MGCTSSSPAVVDTASPTTKNGGAANTHGKNERQITAGTEAMATTSTASATAPTTTIDIASKIASFNPSHSSPTPRTVGSLSLRYAALSHRGRDPDHPSKPNQDCFGHHYNQHSAFFAVYDGHGPVGEQCSHFVRSRLPQLLKKGIQTKQSPVSHTDAQAALFDAHVDVNEELRAEGSINDAYSGTTSVGVLIHANEITMCNVGDSRIVLGSSAGNDGNRVQAVPLSKDHTPYREDEAKRCTDMGARILSFGQIDPSTIEEDIDDDVEDPPRIWAQDGHYPGTAFTRSIGDSVAEKFGVFAEPELLTLPITSSERVLVVASDGVFDVMSNQEAVDIAFRYRSDPGAACKAVIDRSHEEWLLNDDCCEDEANYDDMTVIVIYFDHPDHGDVSNVGIQDQPDQKRPERHHKRVRQKTLRNLEEMKE